ncbi:ABC transporter substrate-binding protein [Lysinibacillus sp. OF-1]|uniref:ABC transporter substrate-binding protein n=1 Tax=Lysinibacillus sp. OF-1 TaxID=2972483 RepID=UPI00232F4D00|nr:ABC transporter substrate-binding protein [Lysinibacillus sp. OF-1]WCH47636.1 ABC transporter substrate-binding protein [Lysinibacillus sp. OF-1]
MNKYIKKAVLVMLVMSLLLIIAACSSKTEGTKDDKESTTTETTRIVTDSVGREVEVPIDLQRVIVDWDLGHVLAVGIVPVASTTKVIDYGEFLKDYYQGQDIVDLGNEDTVSLETATSLKPDLIITFAEENIKQYEKIAPTIVFSTDSYDSVEAEILAIGEMLNHQEEAKKFMADYTARAKVAEEKIKAVIPEGITFSLFTLTDKEIVVIPSGNSGGEAMYDLLKLTAPTSIQKLIEDSKGDWQKQRISWETVGDYVGDYVGVLDYGQKYETTSTWDNLEVVKNNKVITFDGKYFFSADPISVIHQAEHMAEQIIELVQKQ